MKVDLTKFQNVGQFKIESKLYSVQTVNDQKKKYFKYFLTDM